jgi:nucleotide-binding universal stress UspA family protein
LQEKIRLEVRRLIQIQAFRVTCLTVHEPDAASEGTEYQELSHGLHTQRLMELRHWAAPLGLSPERLRFHVLTGSNAAEAIVEYAQLHHVDLIVLGARGHSGLRRFLGSVSAKVAAEAPCSVTIVRKYQSRPPEKPGWRGNEVN